MIIPAPIGAAEIICGQGVIFGLEVHANQNIPMGSRAPPMIMGRSRSSGMTLPASWYLRAKRVLVRVAIITQPMRTPMRTERKGREPTPRFQPRSSWKDTGKTSKKP
jgi:hypothetical protein